MTALHINTGPDRELSLKLKRMGFKGTRMDFIPFNEPHNEHVAKTAVATPDVDCNFLIHGMFMQHGNGAPLDWNAATDSFAQGLTQFEKYYPHRSSSWSIEVFNEPTLAPKGSVFKDPVVMALLWDTCFKLVRRRGINCKLITPPPHNIDKHAGFAWLNKFLQHVEQWDKNCAVGIHRYIPNLNATAQEGWKDRPTEQRALDGLLSGRRLWVTETGITQGPHEIKSWFGLRKKKLFISEQRQGALIMSELLYWRDRADVVTLYNINSGADKSDREQNYGIRRADMQFKEYADLFLNVSERMQA